MRDVVDAEFSVVEPTYRPFKFRWLTAIYFAIFYAACIYAAVSQEDPWTRAAAVIGAIVFGPMLKFFGLAAQRVSEQEAHQLRSRLLSRPASVWERAAGRRGRA